VKTPNTSPRVDEQRRSRSAAKTAETVRRRKAERRTDKLDQIQDQIADGTLVVRQMTASEHEAAFEAARQRLARTEARRKRGKGTG
jgi:hypothetical protein